MSRAALQRRLVAALDLHDRAAVLDARARHSRDFGVIRRAAVALDDFARALRSLTEPELRAVLDHAAARRAGTRRNS